MTIIQPTRQPANLLFRFLGGIALALAGTLLLFLVSMRPPAGEFRSMTLFLAVSSMISLVAGFIAYRWGWINRSPQLKWTLIGGYTLSTALTFVNVWLTAQLMFINPHDLTLATILLLFAGGIAIALGYFLSASLTDNIDALNRAAGAIARGAYDVQVAVTSKDEMADLAASFNTMASQLAEAQQKKLQADGMVDDEATAERYLRTAKRDIGSLSLLIDDLFEMAQIDAGGLKLACQPTNLSDLISDTLESFSTTAADKGIRLGGSVAAGVDPVTIDIRQIGRVLNNLIGNAMRHTPAGGRVEVQAWLSGTQVVVEVADSGEGIRTDDLPHIFEQFYRGEKSRNRATGGSGLGLAIAKSIIEAHRGTISVESQAGQGTTVRFSLEAGGARYRNPLTAR